MSMQKIFHFVATPFILFTGTIGSFPFYIITVESFYTGELNFDLINGVDEGSVLILLLCIFIGCSGNPNILRTPFWVPFIEKEIEVHLIIETLI